MDPYEHDDVEYIHQEVHIEAKPVNLNLFKPNGNGQFNALYIDDDEQLSH